jgi:polyribonucleotide nucleotidyltransferase
MSQQHRVEADLGDGRKFVFESGWLAKQANGACMATLGETMVLAASVAGPAREGTDFFPLTIDYREKMAAAGRFPGGFIKREGRPSNKEILTARLCDRPIRPLWPDGYFMDVQVLLTVFSADQLNDPDIISMNASSAALMVSDLPFQGPVGSVRIGLLGDRFVVCPSAQEVKESRLDLVISGTKDGIIMVEAGAREVSEEQMLQAFEVAQAPIRALIDAQLKLKELAGKPLAPVEPTPFPEAIAAKIRQQFLPEMKKAFFIKIKRERNKAFADIGKRIFDAFIPKEANGLPVPGSPTKVEVSRAHERVVDELVREYALANTRADGRGHRDVRPITIQLGMLPRTHGSSLFTRGETQALCTATLGTSSNEQIVEGLEEPYSQRFMLHYNFPNFSVGEVKPIRGPGRREIGHGALAERAIEAVMPTESEFPYTVRIISDILESNGSSSMATVCGGCLALMDAGVPIKAPVAGIAMGLITGKGGKHAILTDIQGAEDHSGDMDFKVAGTEEGVTALQMDIKVKGITFRVMEQALAQARAARLQILEHLKGTIAKPRPDLSPFAPRMLTLKIPTDKIGAVIGPGGSVIRKMIEEFGVTIDISDDGTVVIGSPDKTAAEGAKAQIEAMTREVEVGTIYKGKVVRIMPFGAFVQLLPSKDGLVHISELSDRRVPTVESVVQLGDPLEVMVTNIDHLGRVDASARAVIEMRRRQGEAERLDTSQINVEDYRTRRGPPPGDREGGRGRFGDRGGRGRYGDRDGGRGRFGDADRGGRSRFGDGGRGAGLGAREEEPVESGPRGELEPEDREEDAPERPGELPERPGGRRQVGGFGGGRPTPPPMPPRR